MNIYKITTSIVVGLIGLFGIGTLTYIIWNCMLYGGNNWELPVRFNKNGEGNFEITMITLFFVLYIIGMGYIIIDGFNRKKAKIKANEIFKKLDYRIQQKHKSLITKLNETK